MRNDVHTLMQRTDEFEVSEKYLAAQLHSSRRVHENAIVEGELT